MKIGIIVAMDKELWQLQQVFRDSSVRVEKCGIGKVNAALGAQRMINEFRPDCIISSGCAGGHGDGISVCDVVVSTALAYHDVYCGAAVDGSVQYGQVQGMPARFAADPYLLRKARETHPLPLPVREGSIYSQGGTSAEGLSSPLLPDGDGLEVRIRPGLIVTGDWFVDSREKMRSIVEKFPDARAVDMESAAIAHACYINKVPFISLRIISDVPLSDTKASQYHNFWDRIADGSFQVTRTFVDSL